MNIIKITSLDHPGLEPYAKLTDKQMRNVLHPADAIIVVESPKVITTALNAGCEPLSLLCEQRHIEGDAKDILARVGDIPVFTGSREVLASLTGYTLTRGVLCAMRRPVTPLAADVCRGARRVVVIDAVCDTTNIGAIFRSAAALGIDAALLTGDSCDPFNRRAIRVSMGTVFQLPWAWIDSPDEVRNYGFKTVAMALRHDSISLDAPALKAEPHLAIVMGTEGDGLPAEAIAGADYVVKIPMRHGVDSLNVAAASAVAFYELTR
jgi:tRNA G18 (ribose-2'-O)-methylase SpoU